MLEKKRVTFDHTVVVHTIPFEGNAHPLLRQDRNPALKTYDDIRAEVVRRRWISAANWREEFQNQMDFLKEIKQKNCWPWSKGGDKRELQETIDMGMLELSLLLSLKWHYNIDIDPRKKR